MTAGTVRRYVLVITDPTTNETTTVEAASWLDLEAAVAQIWPTPADTENEPGRDA